MKITSSTVLHKAVATVTSDASVDLPENVIGYDFSKKYTSAGTGQTLTFSFAFPVAERMSCIAIAGHTSTSRVEVFSAGASVGFYQPVDKRSGCIFIDFDEIATTEITVVFSKTSPTEKILVSHITAGSCFKVPNAGEQSGYSRLWLAPSKKQKAVTSSISAPVSIINKNISPKATLSIPNMPRAVAEGSYRDLCDYMIDNAFFIIERDGQPNSSYLCFGVTINPPKAHSKTRQLVSASFSFHAYTGV